LAGISDDISASTQRLPLFAQAEKPNSNGSKKVEMIYCNLIANQNGTTSFNFTFN
jgi:hypothetical protein